VAPGSPLRAVQAGTPDPGSSGGLDYGRELDLGEGKAASAKPAAMPPRKEAPGPVSAAVPAASAAGPATATKPAPAAKPAASAAEGPSIGAEARGGQSRPASAGGPQPIVVPVRIPMGMTGEVVLRIVITSEDEAA
jgi:hypothetical protein